MGFGMQGSKDDMSGILAELATIFVQSSGVLAQSLKLWAHLEEKSIQSPNAFSQSSNKWAQLVEGVHGEQSGVSIDNVRKLWMWTNQKMKSTMFIHNDDPKCLHVVAKGHVNL